MDGDVTLTSSKFHELFIFGIFRSYQNLFHFTMYTYGACDTVADLLWYLPVYLKSTSVCNNLMACFVGLFKILTD